MTKTLFLHIGAPKCGSTYIQRTALKNQKHMRDHGVNYPHLSLGHPGNAGAIDQVTTPWVQQNIANFDALYLSHEDLFAKATSARKLRNITQELAMDVHIICVIRPLTSWLCSDFSQSIRQAKWKKCLSPTSFTSFVEHRKHSLKPAQFIHEWQSIFADSQMHLIPLTQIPERYSQLHTAFTDVDWSIPQWRRNPSPEPFTAAQINGFQDQKIEMLNRYGMLI